MRKPYRVKFSDNPYQFGRATMPRGALLSGGPNVNGPLGASYGMAPAPPAPSTFQTALNALKGPSIAQGAATALGIPQFPTDVFTNLFKQLGNTGTRTYQGTSTVLKAAVTPPKPDRGINDLGGRSMNLPTPLGAVPPTGQSLRYAKEMGGAQPTDGTGQPTGSGSHNFERNPNVAAMNVFESGGFPMISLQEAARAGMTDDLLAMGYTVGNNNLIPPPGAYTDTQNGQPVERPTDMIKYGGGRDKWASRKWVENWQRRKIREFKSAGDKPKQEKKNEYRAFGLVDFNVSAG